MDTRRRVRCALSTFAALWMPILVASSEPVSKASITPDQVSLTVSKREAGQVLARRVAIRVENGKEFARVRAQIRDPKSHGWLALRSFSSSETVVAPSTQWLELAIDPTMLSPGSYQATVEVSGASPNLLLLPVRLVISTGQERGLESATEKPAARPNMPAPAPPLPMIDPRPEPPPPQLKASSSADVPSPAAGGAAPSAGARPVPTPSGPDWAAVRAESARRRDSEVASNAAPPLPSTIWNTQPLTNTLDQLSQRVVVNPATATPAGSGGAGSGSVPTDFLPAPQTPPPGPLPSQPTAAPPKSPPGALPPPSSQPSGGAPAASDAEAVSAEVTKFLSPFVSTASSLLMNVDPSNVRDLESLIGRIQSQCSAFGQEVSSAQNRLRSNLPNCGALTSFSGGTSLTASNWRVAFTSVASAGADPVCELIALRDLLCRQVTLAPVVQRTAVSRSGPMPSGRYDGWSPLYTLCSDPLQPGEKIVRFEFHLEGDRSCSGWAQCRTSVSMDSQVCWAFQMQGHNEYAYEVANPGKQGVGLSEGILTVFIQK